MKSPENELSTCKLVANLALVLTTRSRNAFPFTIAARLVEVSPDVDTKLPVTRTRRQENIGVLLTLNAMNAGRQRLSSEVLATP